MTDKPWSARVQAGSRLVGPDTGTMRGDTSRRLGTMAQPPRPPGQRHGPPSPALACLRRIGNSGVLDGPGLAEPGFAPQRTPVLTRPGTDDRPARRHKQAANEDRPGSSSEGVMELRSVATPRPDTGAAFQRCRLLRDESSEARRRLGVLAPRPTSSAGCYDFPGCSDASRRRSAGDISAGATTAPASPFWRYAPRSAGIRPPFATGPGSGQELADRAPGRLPYGNRTNTGTGDTKCTQRRYCCSLEACASACTTPRFAFYQRQSAAAHHFSRLALLLRTQACLPAWTNAACWCIIPDTWGLTGVAAMTEAIQTPLKPLMTVTAASSYRLHLETSSGRRTIGSLLCQAGRAQPPVPCRRDRAARRLRAPSVTRPSFHIITVDIYGTAGHRGRVLIGW